MMNEKILLNKAKGKLLNNSNTILKPTIESNSRLLPIGENEKILDEYKQYLKEKKESYKYRLSFSINPICSNVLFNNVSEIIYKEGSNECVVFNKSGATKDVSGLCEDYIQYKYGNNGVSKSKLTRSEMLRDTSYSHPSILDVTYHCGYDIFNNHVLRQKEVTNINKIDNGTTDSEKTCYFNTLFDYKRYHNGKIVTEKKEMNDENERELHAYLIDTVYNFENSINENLAEKDGWFGFINKTLIDIPNFNNITLNKCLNNREACEFIDMYPDRSLFSFTPKLNKYRGNRVERNWDYCLTFPYENYKENDVVSYIGSNDTIINGLKCRILEDIYEGNEVSFDFYDENPILTFKTDIKHNFNKNSKVELVFIGSGESTGTTILYTTCEVINSTDRYTFKVYGDEIINTLFKFTGIPEIRARRIAGGHICEYYFRKFRRIPNFKNSNTIKQDISDDDVLTFSSKDFNSCNNALGFSKNIYSDGISQILFNDDINVGELKDNLGRRVNEVFLTIVKNNKGNVEWYDNRDYTNSAITFSHCFSKVTSGIDIRDNSIRDYNIHTIHNTPTGITAGVNLEENEYYKNIFVEDNNKKYRLPYVLENDINIHGSVDNENIFFGDIVEFSPSILNEVVLEDVYHRFNTRQREYWKDGDKEYNDIFKDEILRDDFEVDDNSTFTRYEQVVTGGYKYNTYYSVNGDKITELTGKTVPINIAPEGYYYKPHYSIKLREYKGIVNEGQHTRVVLIEGNSRRNGDIISFKTNKNYFLEVGKELYLYNRETLEKKKAIVYSVDGKYFTEISILVKLGENEDITDYVIYKPNSEKPEYAYELEDGSGIYLWRDELDEYEYGEQNEIGKYVFTNGAHYINKDIVFFLRRQDPNAYYGLSTEANESPLAQNLTIGGYDNDYSSEEFIDEEEGTIC